MVDQWSQVEDPVGDEIRKQWLYIALKYGTLYVFFFFFHLIAFAAARTFLLFLRIRRTGYKDRSEELTYKDYVKDNMVWKSFAMVVLVLMISGCILKSELTIKPFATSGLIFYSAMFVVKIFKIDLIKFI